MAEKHPEVKISEDLLRDYSSVRDSWASQAAEDNEFRNGAQWTKSQIDALRQRAQEPSCKCYISCCRAGKSYAYI